MKKSFLYGSLLACLLTANAFAQDVPTLTQDTGKQTPPVQAQMDQRPMGGRFHHQEVPLTSFKGQHRIQGHHPFFARHLSHDQILRGSKYLMKNRAEQNRGQQQRTSWRAERQAWHNTRGTNACPLMNQRHMYRFDEQGATIRRDAPRLFRHR